MISWRQSPYIHIRNLDTLTADLARLLGIPLQLSNTPVESKTLLPV